MEIGETCPSRIMNIDIEALQHLHQANGRYLRWALLAWILAIAVGLGIDGMAGSEWAEPIYLAVSLAGLLGLLSYGTLNIWFGIVKDFSATQILITAAALFVGGVGLTAVTSKLPPPGLLAGLLLFLAGMAGIWHWQRRQRQDDQSELPTPPLNDASIRGAGSIFQYGSDAYRMVARNTTGKNTPAEQFEKKLIRYLERKLEIEPLSMAGSNTSYWRLRLPSGIPVELSVIGPGYNSSAKIGTNERWLLRVREPKPGFFANWLAKHFPAGAGISRDLGAEIQTQFASSQLEDDRAFFGRDIEVPVVGIRLSPEAVVNLLDSLEARTGSTPETGRTVH